MNIFSKLSTILHCLFLFVGCYDKLHATHSTNLPYSLIPKEDHLKEVSSPKRNFLIYGYCRVYRIPSDLCFLIRCLVYDNPFQYRNKPLPEDLSYKDLSGFDFTGCHFIYTNLTGSNLANVVLTSTTCDYQKELQDNIKKKQPNYSSWCQQNFPKDLKSIAKVYPKLNKHSYKAKLLKIASALSRFPFYDYYELLIKLGYWSCELLQLKQSLGNPYGSQIVCTLEQELKWNKKYYCWTTNYPQDQLTIHEKAPHSNFDIFLKEFTTGMTQYQCKQTDHLSASFDSSIWYKREILNNIKQLKSVYPHIKDSKLQQEACDIAHALSKSYQVQKMFLLNHYLFCQNRILELKKSVAVAVKNKLNYDVPISGIYLYHLLGRYHKR